MAVRQAPTDALLAQVTSRDWYHTLELAPGLLTPGWFDTRGIVAELPIPFTLAGMRCLDIGTFDGFWAFEMERRGADEVVAIDLLDLELADWPSNSAPETLEAINRRKDRGRGFEIAHEILGSSVVRHDLSVYDLDPESVGSFDFIYLGSLLLHLRDPIRALERVRTVCRGRLLIVDSIDPLLTRLFPRRPVARLDVQGRPWWWTGNIAGVVRMAEAARFRAIRSPRRLLMPAGAGQPRPPLRRSTLASAEGRRMLWRCVRGDPHVALLVAPT